MITARPDGGAGTHMRFEKASNSDAPSAWIPWTVMWHASKTKHRYSVACLISRETGLLRTSLRGLLVVIDNWQLSHAESEGFLTEGVSYLDGFPVGETSWSRFLPPGLNVVRIGTGMSRLLGRQRAHRCSSGAPAPERVKLRHACPLGEAHRIVRASSIETGRSLLLPVSRVCIFILPTAPAPK